MPKPIIYIAAHGVASKNQTIVPTSSLGNFVVTFLTQYGKGFWNYMIL